MWQAKDISGLLLLYSAMGSVDNLLSPLKHLLDKSRARNFLCC